LTTNKVIIDLGAVRHNFRQIKTLAGAGVVAVVKSDAYGHGMIPVAQTLEPEGPTYFGVFELEEAMELKASGCGVPILIMMGILAEQVSAVVDNGFTVALFQKAIARRISDAAQQRQTVVPVHIKVDTGMTRLGVTWADLPDFLQYVLPLKGIHLKGMFSHFAVSDEPDLAFTNKQRERFLWAVNESDKLNISFDDLHVSNSGAILTKKGLDFGLVRPGIALYGSSPAKMPSQNISLKRAMSFKSRIVQLRSVPADTPVSYGCTYNTKSSSTIATIPVGYDDGYNRLLSNNGEVLVRGTRVPVVGRVCMNLTMLDVSSVEGVSVGDEAVLLGAQGKEEITAEEIAEKIGTINYEIYCSIGKSNLRSYLYPTE